MDQDVANALADIRYQLAQLRSALDVSSPNEAETEVAQLKATVTSLVAWGTTVFPPYSP